MDQLESLDVGDRGILDEWVSACGGLWRLGLWATQVWARCTRRFPEAMDHLGSVWGHGDAGHFMRAGLCSAGRWDPSQRQCCDRAGWGKLSEAGGGRDGPCRGPIRFDRVVFEMATRGEARCSLA